jgi:pimeloyl-ACP methyl ester carboxylesterase
MTFFRVDFGCGKPDNQAQGQTVEMIDARSADVDGEKLDYLTEGQGPAIVLLHGYAETSPMWKPIIPPLAERFTVIAPGLPGIGDSSIPETGLDMASAAIRIHALVLSLGFQKTRVVGHDIGLMVAYASAGQFSAEVEKLVLMDAFLPGTDTLRRRWWKAANGSISSISGTTSPRTKRVRLPEEARQVCTAASARPGRMRAGWACFVSFQKAASDFAALARTKLPRPLLSMGARKRMAMFWASR